MLGEDALAQQRQQIAQQRDNFSRRHLRAVCGEVDVAVLCIVVVLLAATYLDRRAVLIAAADVTVRFAFPSAFIMNKSYKVTSAAGIDWNSRLSVTRRTLPVASKPAVGRSMPRCLSQLHLSMRFMRKAAVTRQRSSPTSGQHMPRGRDESITSLRC
jgi:hypothetical protein